MTLSADGLYTIAVRVTDAAGNSIVRTQTVRLDRSGPTISASLPSAPSAPSVRGYDLGAAPVFSFGGSDVSGISSAAATLDSTISLAGGAALNLFTLRAGTHTIVVTATDGLGNTSSTTVTFEVHATVQGLLSALTYGATNKLIANQFQSTLTSTLQAVQSALNAGNVTAAKSYLNSFVTQIQQASSSKIDPAFAALLVNWAQDLIARL